MDETIKEQLEKMDLLQAFESIVDKAKGSSLSDEFYQKADTYLSYVSEKLGVSKRASVILSLFADRCDDRRIQLSDYTSYLDCRILTLLRYSKEIKELIDKEYVCEYKDDGLYYNIPMEVMEAFQRNERYVPSAAEELTTRELFEEFDNLFSKCRRNKLSPQILCKKMRALATRNSHLEFIKSMLAYGIDIDDDKFPLFVRFCTAFVINSDDEIEYHDLEFIYVEDDPAWRLAKRGLSAGSHFFFRCNFIEYNIDNGFVDRESFKITDEAKMKLFSELYLSSLQGKRIKGGMISCDGIKEKTLFYNDKEKKKIADLSSLLEEENYKLIRQRLSETNFRSGFACLFYGAPGTGKTETVLQIAKKTGRDLIQVNVSEIKSMWVGESEKNIKGIFDDYKEKVKQSTKAPILLFNEADAIIGKRQVGAERAVEKMENSIQNIILQEIEQLDGILIATTNLAENMDKAFERRFLYKIRFEKPDIDSRYHIWQAMIPSLCSHDASYLAKKYDFSGGEIENIARHYTIQSILHGKPENMVQTLTEFCESERLEGAKTKRKIGF